MSSLHFNSKPVMGVLVLMLLASILLAPLTAQVEAAVGLTYFRVNQGANPTNVTVSWETETERDLVAFRVKRNSGNDPAGATVVHVEQPRGTSASGSTYSFDDTLPAQGVYYYWLYEVTSSGAENVLASASNSAAPTATPTNTPIATATPTNTVPSVNVPQATNTPTPTATPTRAVLQDFSQPTNTPPPTETPFVPTNTPIPNAFSAPPTIPAQPTDTPVAPISEPTPVAVQNAGDAATPPEQPTQASAPQGGPVAPEAPPVEATAAQIAELQGAAEQPAVPPAGAEAEAASPTAQAMAQAVTATPAPAGAPALAARPTATPRPSRESAGQSNASSLLLVIGGGSLCGAVLLVLVGVFVWRRR